MLKEKDGKSMLNLIFTLRGAKTSSLSRAVKAFEVRAASAGLSQASPGPWGQLWGGHGPAMPLMISGAP